MTSYVWPENLIATDVEWYLRNNNTIFESPITRTRQVLGRQGARYVASMRFLLTRDKWQRMDALLEKLRGSFNTVAVWDMSQTEPLGPNLDNSSITGTYYLNTPGSPGGRVGFLSGGSRYGFVFRGGVTVYGEYAVGEQEVTIRGFPQYSTPLLAGDYVGLNDRLYKLTEDAEANGLGRAVLYLNRGLLSALTNGMVVTRTRCRTPMVLVDDDQPRGSSNVNRVKTYSLSFVEALEEAA